MHAVGVEYIAAMEKLVSLGEGIYHLEGFGFLHQVMPRLKKLFLGRTKSNKPNLSALSRFVSLEEIYIESQHKNIDVLSQLENLQAVTLRSISTPGLGYMRSLHHVWSLDIKMAGIRDLYAIEGLESIKYLDLWQIRGLPDIGVISSPTGLQFLFPQSLRQVTALPSFKRLKNLRRRYLENLKGLEDLGSLEFAPALEEFVHASARNLRPEDHIPLLRNPTLKRAAVGFGSHKKDTRFNELVREHNINQSPGFEEFEFV